MTRAFFALAVLAAGCTELADLDRGVCGNGIVEAGEDCDSSREQCVSCGVTCSAEATCDSYGAGFDSYVCGADGFCHAPAGAFEPLGELSLAVDSLRVTDLDADGYGDVVVQATTAIQVLPGNPDGTLAIETSILSPIASGPVSFSDLDEDGSLDLVLPTPDGIAAFTSQFGALSPHPFPTLIEPGEGVPANAFRMRENRIGFFAKTGPNAPCEPNMFSLIVVAVGPSGARPESCAPLCGISETGFARTHVDLFEIAPRAGVKDATHYVVAVTVDPTNRGGQAPRSCLFSVDRNEALDPMMSTYVITPITAPVGPPPISRPVLVPLRGGICPSLVVRDQANALVEYAATAPNPSTVGPRCSLATSAATSFSVSPPGQPIGWIPLMPARAGAATALVLDTGVHALEPAGATPMVGAFPMFYTDRTLATVRAVDVDRDGDVDFVASARDYSLPADEEEPAGAGQPAEDLDVFARIPDGSPDGFVRTRVDTAAPVTTFELGDFDGDRNVDVALAMQRFAADADAVPVRSDELAVAYGGVERFAAPVASGRYGQIRSLVPTSFPDSNDQSNVITDLVVLFQSGPMKREITVLHGSPQRTLIAYFDPRPIPTATADPFNVTPFLGAVAGRFLPNDPLPGRDLIAIEGVVTATSGTHLWLSPGASGGIIRREMPIPTPLVEWCAHTGADPAGTFCIDTARFLSVPGTVRDRVVGLDGEGHGFVIDPGDVPVTVVPWSPWTTSADTRPRALETFAITGKQLVLATRASADGRGAGAVVCPAGETGGIPACIDLTVALKQRLPAQNLALCVDAVAARLPVLGVDHIAVLPTLVALCRVGTADGPAVLVRATVADGELADASFIGPVAKADQLQVGDVDGDGLDDLVTIDRSTSVPVVRTLRQCTSRTPGCRAP